VALLHGWLVMTLVILLSEVHLSFTAAVTSPAATISF
jgi:hypothetical protein